MRWGTLVALCLLSLGGPAESQAGGPRRFHLARPELVSRLGPDAKRNVAAVGQYTSDGKWRGTAFLVTKPGADGTALAMTNWHVHAGGPIRRLWSRLLGRKDAIRFTATQSAAVLDVVAGSRHLDYALVRVRVQPGFAPEPVRLSTATAGPGERVYVVGFPALFTMWRGDRQGALGGSAAARSWIERDVETKWSGGSKVISTGRELLNGGVRRLFVPGAVSAAANQFSALAWGGNSGSPILSSESHTAVALAHQVRSRPGLTLLKNLLRGTLLGRVDPQGYDLRGIPAPRLLEDLRNKLANGEVRLEHRPLLESMLSR